MPTFTTYGALIGLALAIVLILRKIPPAYSLILGALVGGLIGGGGLAGTLEAMSGGAESMISAILRILTSGVLAGALIQTGAAEKLAQTIVRGLGTRFALAAVAAASMLICAVGVFADIAVITVAPVALSVAKAAGHSRSGVLLAMIGGVKAGNILSPNPNTIAVAGSFGVDLTSLMLRNFIPAVCALAATILLSALLSKRGEAVTDAADSDRALPNLAAAVSGPAVVILLLALRPICGVDIDPLIALPAGGIVCTVATGNWRKLPEYAVFGLEKVVGVSVLLLGTGTLAGIIKASALQADVTALLELLHLPALLLAPLSGVLMSAATASTTAGSTIAAQTFAAPLLEAGIAPLSAGAMIHAGATVLDSLPHGSFFHATGGSVGMSMKERLKLLPWEAAIGGVSAAAATVVSLVL